MDTIKRFFSGLMWAAWFFLGALMLSLSSEFNPGYGLSDGVIVPSLGYLFMAFGVISMGRWVWEFIQERKQNKSKW